MPERARPGAPEAPSPAERVAAYRSLLERAENATDQDEYYRIQGEINNLLLGFSAEQEISPAEDAPESIREKIEEINERIEAADDEDTRLLLGIQRDRLSATLAALAQPVDQDESVTAPPVIQEMSAAATAPVTTAEVHPDTPDASAAPEPETPPSRIPGARRVGIVGIDAKIDEIARHRAEERLQRELRGDFGDRGPEPWWARVGHAIGDQVRKSVRHTAEEFYRQRYIQEETNRLRDKMTELHPNAFSPDGTKAEFAAESRAIVERFLSTYDELVETDAGEKKTNISAGPDTEKLRSLIARYANKEIDESGFAAERTVIMNELRTKHGDVFAQNETAVDNLFEIANEFRVAADHGERVRALDVQVDLTLGQARSAIKDQTHLRSFDRLVKFMQTKPVLRNISNPMLLGLATSLATAPARFLLSQGSKVAHIASPVAAATIGAGFAAMRRNTELKGDVSHTRRGLAMGYEIPTGAKRLERMAEFAYDMKEAGQLSGDIRQALEQVRGLDPRDPGFAGAYDRLTVAIAEADGRHEAGDLAGHDFIKYSGNTKIEQERFELLRTLAEAKVAHKKAVPAHIPPEATLEARMTTVMESLKANMDDQDRRFASFKNKEVIKAALYGAGTGLVVGSLFQFGVRKVQEIFDPHAPQSAIEKLWDTVRGHQDVVPTTEHSYTVGQGGRLVLPEGWRAIDTPGHPNEITIFDDHGRANTIGVDQKTGAFDPDRLSELRRAGALISERVVSDSPVAHEMPVKEYVAERTDMLHIARGPVPHLDNDTPGTFDLNELRLDKGGVENTGITADGKFQFNVSRMTAEGSFKGLNQVDMAALRERGALKLLLSLSRETQKMVFEIPIDADGNATIDPNSEIGKQLFRNVDGKMEFLGRFAEVARHLDNPDGSPLIDANGEQHVQIAATYEGPGKDVIAAPTPSDITITTFEQPRDWEGPWVMPLSRRNPLESFAPRRFRPEYIVGRDDQRARWEQERSPRLKENPDTRLDMREEIDWYFQEQERRYGADYIVELDHIVERDERLRSLDPKTEIIVTMPVATAHEDKNIYSTLELYAAQHQEAIDRTTIFLNLNWIEGADQERIDRTLQEVARAQKDFPHLKIATMQKEWSREFVAKKDKKIFGEVVKYMNDAALRAIQRSPIDHDVYFLTNDADARGMSLSYLKVLERNIHDHPETDGFLGKLEWGTESYDKYPGYHVTARVMQILESMYRHGIGQHRNVASSGANFLVKAATYAAVGGYNRDMGAGADTDLGRRIKAARFGDRKELNVDQYPLRYANAAWIDTDPSRALEFYRDGKPIISMWSEFDAGGYAPRGELIVNGTEERLGEDFETIVDRIEFQVTALIDNWVSFENVETYSKALNLALPPQEGKPLWTTHHQDGQTTIRLTGVGRVWLKKQLTAYRDHQRQDTLYQTRGRRAKKRAPREA